MWEAEKPDEIITALPCLEEAFRPANWAAFQDEACVWECISEGLLSSEEGAIVRNVYATEASEKAQGISLARSSILCFSTDESTCLDFWAVVESQGRLQMFVWLSLFLFSLYF